MIGLLNSLARPLMGLLAPENAHRLAINALKLAPLAPPAANDARLAVRVFGLNFPNPVGMAPGFDKHAEVPDALLRVGFGFVEIGTVTPLPQPGNPRPRLFRLNPDQGVINRLGFNSEGADAVLARLAARAHEGGIVGVNVGANKDRPTASPTMCARSRCSRRSRATSPATFPRPIRPACATCSRARFSTSCCRA